MHSNTLKFAPLVKKKLHKLCWLADHLHRHGLPPWAWPKKGLSAADYSSRARAWNFFPFEKFLPRTGAAYQVFLCSTEGHWFWKTSWKYVIDLLQKFHFLLTER